MSLELSTRQLTSLQLLSPAEWNTLGDGNSPFIRHEYLSGLEQHDCLAGHGWIPQHLLVCSGDLTVGAMPLYIRSNSYGEFVFDWSWADAYEQAGGRYYPKLVSAIPFAPVLGPRLLVHPDFPDRHAVQSMLARQLIRVTDEAGLSSCHILFSDPAEGAVYQSAGYLQRLTCQFHWHNRAYRDFDDFLDTLTSKKRKQIRRERRLAVDNGIEIEVLTGKEISESQWQDYYRFYCSTFHRRWGSPRLTPAFFRMLGRQLPEQTLLILARQGRDYVAGAFGMLGNDTVFGRHWGCSEQFPFLHFELCYYQTIEYAIKHRLQRVDAGVQGEHKLARGFEPVAAESWHWLRHPGFRQAVHDFLVQETAEVKRHIHTLREQLPYR